MSTSADLVQVAIAAEDVYGQTPANPVFLVVRITGEGIAFAPTTTKSNEMNAARMVTDSILTGGSVTGDLNFEMAHEQWFDELLAGAFCNEWVSNALRIGTEIKSFTVEKMIPVPGGITQYHRYRGCTVNGFSFDVKPNQAITGSFSMLGKDVGIDTAPIAGSTYVNPHLTPVMTAPRVVGIEIGGIPAVSQCFNNLQIAMNNNNRAIECIGTLGAKELALGRAEITATFGVLFSDSTLLQTLLTQTETSLAFQTNDTLSVGSPVAHNFFEWYVPRVKFTANPVVAGGTGQDVVNDVTAEGLLDSLSGTAFQVTRSPLIYQGELPPAGAPVITSATSANPTIGTPFTYVIAATNSPTNYSATGLPVGFSIDTTTGHINGTAVTAVTSAVTISASNILGTGTTTLTLNVTVDTKPKWGIAAANAYLSLQALLNSMSDLVGSSNGGRAGTFTLATTPGNYGWVAVKTTAVAAGMHFYDGTVYGHWSGAGLVGDNSGGADPSVSAVTFTDVNGTNWTFFRQDVVNSNPSPTLITAS